MGGARHCCIRGCHSRHKPSVKKQEVKFYRLPSDSSPIQRERRTAWLKAIVSYLISNLNLDKIHICSKHFMSGEKASLSDVDSPDWVPQLFPSNDTHFGSRKSNMIEFVDTNKTNSRRPHCLACRKNFTSTTDLMQHMEKLHSTTEDIAPNVQLIQQKMDEIPMLLNNFDWHSCKECIELCDKFFSHITTIHEERKLEADHDYIKLEAFVNKKRKTEDFSTLEENLAGNESDDSNTSKKKLDDNESDGSESEIEQDTKADCSVQEEIVELDDLAEIANEMTNTFPNEYQCSLCGNIYKSRLTVKRCLERHAENHQDGTTNIIEKSTALTVDGPKILSITPLRKFIKKYTSNEFITGVFQPNITFLDSILLENLIDSTPIKCEPCNVIFGTVPHFETHLINIHGDNFMLVESVNAKIRQKIQCTICWDCNKEVATFDTLAHALNHRYEKHRVVNEQPKRLAKPRIIVQSDNTQIVERPNSVRLCRQNGIFEEFQCICDLQSRRKQVVKKCLAQHIGLRRFKCTNKKGAHCDDTCGVEFFTAAELKDHEVRIHFTDAEMTICSTCGLSLPKRALSLHRHSHKLSANGPQSCDECGKTMASQRRLREHKRRVHQKVKKFACSVCFERFVYRGSAELCAAKHTGIKSVSCSECGKMFLTKAQRSAHRLSAHKQSGDYSCVECDISFRTDQLLRKHMQLHVKRNAKSAVVIEFDVKEDEEEEEVSYSEVVEIKNT